MCVCVCVCVCVSVCFVCLFFVCLFVCSFVDLFVYVRMFLYLWKHTHIVMYACFNLNLCILIIGFIVIAVVRSFGMFSNSPGV